MSTPTLNTLRVPALFAAVLAGSLALSGCAGGDDGDNGSRPASTKGGTSTEGGGLTDPTTEQSTDNGGGMMTSEAAPAPTQTEEPFQNPEDSSVFDMEVGDCIANQEDLGAGTEVQSIPKVPCTQPHAYEVHYEFELTGGSTVPDEATIEKEAEDKCAGEAFTNYVGVEWDNSSLGYTYLFPTSQSWSNGDREVTCMLFEDGADKGNPTTGSLKGSGR